MKINKLLTALAALALLAGCKNEKFEEHYVKFSDYAFYVGEDGAVKTMTVTANVPYSVSFEEEWLAVDVVSTSGEESVLNVTVQPNKVTTARSAKVFFKSPGVPTGTLKINQDAAEAVGPTKSAIDIPEDGTTATIDIIGSKSWTISCDEADVTLSQTSGTGPASVTVTLPQNLSSKDRIVTVKVLVNGDTYPVVITQSGVKPGDVTPTALTAAPEETSATFKVTGKQAWSATCENSSLVITPASGTGAADVTLTFPANEGTTNIVYTIVVDIDGTKHNVVLTHKHPVVYEAIADWEFCAENLSYYNEHFTYEAAKVDGKPNPIANAQGFLSDDHYCPAKTGNGKIRFYNGTDKTSVNPDGRCKRGAGNSGEPCWYGNWIDDIVYFEATPSASLAAGTVVNIWFCLRPSTMHTLKYWFLEIKDGDTWYPVGDPQTVGAAQYNIELFYNTSAAGTSEDPTQINTIIDRDYTLKNAASKVEYRMTCTTIKMADGTGDADPTNLGMQSNGKKANPVLRMAGMSATGGAAEVTHHTWIAVVKE